MTRRASLGEVWQGLSRRARLLLGIIVACIVFFTVSHINVDPDPTTPESPQAITKNIPDPPYRPLPDGDYFPDPPYRPLLHGDYFPEPPGLHTIPEDDKSAVLCDWADVDIRGTRKIKAKDGPSFSLLSAWLKPEAARYGPALNTIPLALQDKFTLGGRVRFRRLFFDQAYLGGKAMQSVWKIEEVDQYRNRVRAREGHFTYDNSPLYGALDRWGDTTVRGKRGLVIGSETPWLEAMLLEYGAEHVSTLEFGEIQTNHSQLTTYTPSQFTLSFLQGKIPPFDFVFSYSSLEHDGLGRYGDVLNPFGDLHTMARMLSVVRPGGFMFLGVPCCEDALYWNAHRAYGPVRYREMFAGWRVLGSVPHDAMEGPRGMEGDWVFQPVWALQNRMGCRGGFKAGNMLDSKVFT